VASFGVPELDGQLRQLLDATSKLRDLQEEIAQLTGHGEAADGRIRVEADNAGKLTRLEIDPRAMRMASEDLAEAILEAAQKAADDVMARSQELFDSIMPSFGDLQQMRQMDYTGLPDDAAEALDAVARSNDPIAEVRAQIDRLSKYTSPRRP
jgi:DNA-binding protein YbaB